MWNQPISTGWVVSFAKIRPSGFLKSSNLGGLGGYTWGLSNLGEKTLKKSVAMLRNISITMVERIKHHPKKQIQDYGSERHPAEDYYPEFMPKWMSMPTFWFGILDTPIAADGTCKLRIWGLGHPFTKYRQDIPVCKVEPSAYIFREIPEIHPRNGWHVMIPIIFGYFKRIEGCQSSPLS